MDNDRKLTFDLKVTPSFNAEDQVLQFETSSHAQVVSREVIRFKDETTRKALDALGWVEFLKFQLDVTFWASATFPGQSAESKIAHLADEVVELRNAPTDGEEMADCFILLLNVAQMAGVDLMRAAKLKMEKNRARKWGNPDERGVIKHIP